MKTEKAEQKGAPDGNPSARLWLWKGIRIIF